jgi:flagellar hook protein FlgE
MQVNSSSMTAYTNWMSNNSNNVANINTEGFKATSTTMQNTAGGNVQAVASASNSSTDLARESTDQIAITTGVDAIAKAIKTQDEMIGSLIDLSI